jgi:predicted AlkP superfamily pyrophosphatase or phosphodiesterase
MSVILIGIDGLGRFFNYDNAPNLMKFIKNGYCIDVNAVYPTDSAENWGSILLGVSPNMHNLKLENLNKCYNNSDYPSLFKIIKENYKEAIVGAYVSWKPILSGMIENTVGMTKYSPTIDESVLSKFWMHTSHYFLNDPIYDSYTSIRVIKYIQENKNLKFLFIHLVDLDEVGHICGFGSHKFNQKLKKIDEFIRVIIKSVNDSCKNPLILITTDHGGLGTKHGGNSNQEMEVFIASNINLDNYKCTNNKCCAKIILNQLKIEVPKNFTDAQ